MKPVWLCWYPVVSGYLGVGRAAARTGRGLAESQPKQKAHHKGGLFVLLVVGMTPRDNLCKQSLYQEFLVLLDLVNLD